MSEQRTIPAESLPFAGRLVDADQAAQQAIDELIAAAVRGRISWQAVDHACRRFEEEALPPELQPRLKCACGQDANTVHARPYWTPGAEFIACCPDEDAGGYWFELYGPAGLYEDFADWRRHLSQKDEPTWIRFERWLWGDHR